MNLVKVNAIVFSFEFFYRTVSYNGHIMTKLCVGYSDSELLQ